MLRASLVDRTRTRRCLAAAALVVALPFCGILSGRVPRAAGESGGYSPSFTLGGSVAAPATYTLNDLEALPPETVSVQFRSGAGLEQHTYQGVRLYDLLTAAGPRFDPARKNDKLDWYVRVTAVDGYQAVVAWGELDPDWEAKDILVAYAADGQLLGAGAGMARLVVPGDLQGGRYVSSITAISVERAAE